MKPLKEFIKFSLVGVYLCSCSATNGIFNNNSSSNAIVEKRYEHKEMYFVTNKINQRPQIADLEVAKQRVKYTQTYSNLSYSEVKNIVKGDFMKQQNCDVIVEPLISATITTTESGVSTEATVTGYPAFFRNIKTYELKDSVYFKPHPIIHR